MCSPMQVALLFTGVVELCTSLADQLELEVSATAIFDFPTIASLAQHISYELSLRRTGALTGD